jgi:hypothetical protein
MGPEGDSTADPDALARRWPELLKPGPRMRRAPEVRLDELKDVPREVALGGCRRVALLGSFIVVLLFTVALIAGGPILQILFSILLAR